MDTADRKVLAAKITLSLEHPFWGSLIGSLTCKSDPSCPTAYTNGVVLGYNPEYIDSLPSHDLVVGLIAHEVDHCAKFHPYRRGGRDPKIWNIACDKTVNGDLRYEFKLPDGAIYPEGDEVGKSAEWIYARLAENAAQENPPQPTPEPTPKPDDEDAQGSGDNEGDEDEDGEGSQPGNEDGDEDGEGEGDGDTGGDGDAQGDAQGDGDGSGTGNPTPGDGDPLGEVRDAPTGTDENGEPAPSEDEWKQRASEALNTAKMRGKLPGGVERSMRQALKPKIDVRSLLLRYFQDQTNADYSWTRPNPRYAAMGLYLPKLYSHELGHVAIVNDTSMSRGNVAMDHARQIVQSVLDECNPLAVTVYHADAEVAQMDRIERGETITWNVKGGGGTNFIPALQAIEDEGTAVCAIYITDLEGIFPDVAPSFPVLWLSTEDTTAPFGETVYVEC